jgi:hypothetical protein
MKHSQKTESQRKVQEGHLEDEKVTKPTNGTKSGKTKKKVQLKNSPLIKLPLTLSMQALPFR